VKKEARGLDAVDLGEVQAVEPHYVEIARGIHTVLAGPEGFEPLTSSYLPLWIEGWRSGFFASNLSVLSYGPTTGCPSKLKKAWGGDDNLAATVRAKLKIDRWSSLFLLLFTFRRMGFRHE
jgi:hypothetical protein